MTDNKFQTTIPAHTVERLMTDDEIRERVKELGLNERIASLVEEFILEQFSMARDTLDDPDCEHDEDFFARGDGRLGCFQSHQDVLYDLAGVMGYEDEDTECPEARAVFDRFFAE